MKSSWAAELVLATGNPGKVREWEGLLRGRGIRLRLPGERLEVEEDGASYLENALKKARSYAEVSPGLPVLAEDSGLEVRALDMGPGVFSARVGSCDEDRIRWLLGRLAGEADRWARFVCVAVLLLPDGRAFSFRGELEGAIACAPEGEGGFGYDPVFIPRGVDVTLAQAGDLKDRISHRARAAAKLALFAPLVIESMVEPSAGR
ncbi:xanthosine triphosphate pyrophosphatase [Thermanaerovibrio velox DSM 12556]|uniref:dITP/XTP pyrophosphatase n=1 Tax=Thermanaerovibrio velox DSM 12556 TaxID=926567 RepID=H0UNS6_9BACT|nr:non-canonical purine NTP pyrophosphatase [Thermanaerovibrio velox]EHM09412.1 xanthosine triphosphate pyrophosphatase [Thermanaerovibrio velox DSM 12556]